VWSRVAIDGELDLKRKKWGWQRGWLWGFRAQVRPWYPSGFQRVFVHAFEFLFGNFCSPAWREPFQTGCPSTTCMRCIEPLVREFSLSPAGRFQLVREKGEFMIHTRRIRPCGYKLSATALLHHPIGSLYANSTTHRPHPPFP